MSGFVYPNIGAGNETGRWKKTGGSIEKRRMQVEWCGKRVGLGCIRGGQNNMNLSNTKKKEKEKKKEREISWSQWYEGMRQKENTRPLGNKENPGNPRPKGNRKKESTVSNF